MQQSKALSIDYFAIMGHLIRRDFKVFQEEFWGKFIDTSLLLFTTITVFGYFLPTYGLSANYGSFLLVGVIAGFGFFEVMGKVSMMIADLEGDKTVLYTLSLPLPAWMVFSYFAVSWAILSSTMSALMFPIGKLVLWNQFSFANMSLFKLICIFIMSNLFFGFFALWLVAVLKKMSNLAHLFIRVINPMYSFGGWWYSWVAVFGISSILGYLHLINPLLYVMEGMRAAVLGQEGYLPFWASFFALSGFTLLLAWDAIRRLKKRLDCV